MLDRQVGYVVASHVAEHVPDLIGWLTDIHKILGDGGTIGLAIPDKRFTFDYFRSTSTIAEAVEAYLTPYKVPTVRQIFDSAWQSTQINYEDIWSGMFPNTTDDALRKSRLRPALDLVRRVAATKEYNDAHCWIFTPASFLDLVEQAAYLDLFPFTIQGFAPTPQNGYEFLVVLRKANGSDRLSIITSVDSARGSFNHSSSEKAGKIKIDFETGAVDQVLQKTQSQAHLLQDIGRKPSTYRQLKLFTHCKKTIAFIKGLFR